MYALSDMYIELSPKEYERHLNYDDAKLYCDLLSIDNKDDWRLPSLKELVTVIYDLQPAAGESYWTSTMEITGDPVAMFYNGLNRCFAKNMILTVRAIRND